MGSDLAHSQHHNEVYPTKKRDATSIRRKCNALTKSTKPTGDPNCPSYIVQAKRIMYLISDRAEATAAVEDGELGIVVLDLADAANAAAPDVVGCACCTEFGDLSSG